MAAPAVAACGSAARSFVAEEPVVSFAVPTSFGGSQGAVESPFAQGQLMTQPWEDANQQPEALAVDKDAVIEHLRKITAGLQRDVKDMKAETDNARGAKRDLGRILALEDPDDVKDMLAVLRYQAANQLADSPMKELLTDAAELIEMQALKLRGVDVLQQQLAVARRAHKLAAAAINSHNAAFPGESHSWPMCELVMPSGCCRRVEELQDRLQELELGPEYDMSGVEHKLEATQADLWEEKAAARELQKLLQQAYTDADAADEYASSLAAALEQAEAAQQQAVASAKAAAADDYAARLAAVLEQAAAAQQQAIAAAKAGAEGEYSASLAAALEQAAAAQRNAVAASEALADQQVKAAVDDVRTAGLLQVSAHCATAKYRRGKHGEAASKRGIENMCKQAMLLHVTKLTQAHDHRLMGFAALGAHEDQKQLQLAPLLADAPAQRLLISAATGLAGADTSICMPAVEEMMQEELAAASRTIADLKRQFADARAARDELNTWQ